MNNLFKELYLDENISVIVAEIVRSFGFKAVTTQDVGRKGSSDPEQLEYATFHGFAIVTHNRVDFEELAKEYFASGKEHSGIIIVSDNSPQEIALRLNLILNDLTKDEVTNQLIYI